MSNITLKFPNAPKLFVEEYEIEGMEINEREYNRFSVDFPEEFFKNVVLEDPWPYYCVWLIFDAANITERLQNLNLEGFRFFDGEYSNSDGKVYSLQEDLKNLIPEVSSERVDSFVSILDKRDVTKVIHHENFWFGNLPLELNKHFNYKYSFCLDDYPDIEDYAKKFNEEREIFMGLIDKINEVRPDGYPDEKWANILMNLFGKSVRAIQNKEAAKRTGIEYPNGISEDNWKEFNRNRDQYELDHKKVFNGYSDIREYLDSLFYMR